MGENYPCGNGRPVRVYDIGSVLPRIITSGDFLYFLTGSNPAVPIG